MWKLGILGGVISILFPVAYGECAFAQSESHKFELGSQFSLVHFRNIQSIDPESWTSIFNPPPRRSVDVTDAGFGLRAGYNVFSFLALEVEVNFFPHEKKLFQEGGRKLQLQFGPKAGIRKERFGVYGKFRPGLVRFSALLDCDINTIGCGAQIKTYRAFDVGGVLELYPSGRTLVRFDFGDTMIIHRQRGFVKVFPMDFNSVVFPSATTHNPQFSIGAGYRF
jgi:hypothetical protein